MEDKNFKKIIKELLEIDGKLRGASVRGLYIFLKKKIGVEKIEEIDQRLAECGWRVKLKDIKAMEWYPVGLVGIYPLMLMDIMRWGEKEIEELGSFAPKVSLISKLFGRYYLPPKKSYSLSVKYWKKNFDIGALETPLIDVEKKYLIFRLKDFSVHPLHCVYLKGYMKSMVGFVIKSKNISCEEIKCTHRGDDYHEFIIKWE